jgi:hypothetical protein
MGPPLIDDERLGRQLTICLLPLASSYLARGRIRATTRTLPDESAADFGAPMIELIDGLHYFPCDGVTILFVVVVVAAAVRDG